MFISGDANLLLLAASQLI